MVSCMRLLGGCSIPGLGSPEIDSKRDLLHGLRISDELAAQLRLDDYEVRALSKLLDVLAPDSV